MRLSSAREHSKSISADRRTARLKGDSNGWNEGGFSLDSRIGELNGLRLQQYRGRGKERSARHRHHGANVADVGGMISAVALGRRQLGQMTRRVAVGQRTLRCKRPRRKGRGALRRDWMEMPERQGELDGQREQRYQGTAAEMRPEPVHVKNTPHVGRRPINAVSTRLGFGELIPEMSTAALPAAPDSVALWDFRNAIN